MNAKKLMSLTAAICMAAAVPSMAAQRNWKGNGANTYWNTSGNWDTQPGGSDSLAFRTAGVKNIAIHWRLELPASKT